MATMSFNPQTPQSPSQFSPSSADPLSSMNSSMTSITTSLPTPAHSVSGTTQPDITMSDADSPNKRKRLTDDMGDQEQKKVHLEDPRRLGIENLHLDVGEKYLLCRTPHFASYPRASGDLFEMFGLAGIAAEVARTKPNGEKNALRKTYKGHIKYLGVNGHFDAVKKELDDPQGFMHLIGMPQDVWHVNEVAGKEIEGSFSKQVQSNLLGAMTMAKGPIAKSIWDGAVLGDLAPGNMVKKPKDESSKQGAPGTPAASTGGLAKSGRLQVPQADRSRRIGKKRSYQDSSFEGYGEGFTDDDPGAETGYSTGDGDDRVSKQKRRKQHPGSTSSLSGAGRHIGAIGAR
ncbi:Rox3 mediator complex subunit-domain-containing protein [Xylariales sp. AK1849]|nr:Rox3 mediator complex subunit-domain-containing protein [Xylariales sp. AK1849]